MSYWLLRVIDKLDDYYYGALKLFGLIPIKLDLKKGIVHQHYPSLLYSMVVFGTLLISFPFAYTFLQSEYQSNFSKIRDRFHYKVGLVQTFITIFFLLIIFCLTFKYRHSLEEYFELRLKISADIYNKFPNFDMHKWKWNSAFTLTKTCIIVTFKTIVYIGNVYNHVNYKSDWWMVAIIGSTHLPSVIISLGSGFFYEGTMLIYFFLANIKDEVENRLSKLAMCSSTSCRISHQVWDTVDYLSLHIGDIYDLKIRFNQYIGTFIMFAICQEIMDLIVYGYFFYAGYSSGAWVKPLKVITGSSYMALGFFDLFVAVYLCQLIIGKVGYSVYFFT